MLGWIPLLSPRSEESPLNYRCIFLLCVFFPWILLLYVCQRSYATQWLPRRWVRISAVTVLPGPQTHFPMQYLPSSKGTGSTEPSSRELRQQHPPKLFADLGAGNHTTCSLMQPPHHLFCSLRVQCCTVKFSISQWGTSCAPIPVAHVQHAHVNALCWVTWACGLVLSFHPTFSQNKIKKYIFLGENTEHPFPITSSHESFS